MVWFLSVGDTDFGKAGPRCDCGGVATALVESDTPSFWSCCCDPAEWPLAVNITATIRERSISVLRISLTNARLISFFANCAVVLAFHKNREHSQNSDQHGANLNRSYSNARLRTGNLSRLAKSLARMSSWSLGAEGHHSFRRFPFTPW